MADLALPPDVMRLVAGAHVSSLWLWCLDNTPDGDVSKLTSDEMALGAEWNGDPDLLLHALIESGFVDRDEESAVLHDWYEYAGKLIERRRADRDRKRRQRGGTSGGTSAPVQAEAAHVPSEQAKLPIEVGSTQETQKMPEWLEHLRELEEWPTKGEPHEESLIRWVSRKDYPEDQLERSAIALGKVKQTTLQNYSNLARAFQDRLSKGYDESRQMRRARDRQSSGPRGSPSGSTAKIPFNPHVSNLPAILEAASEQDERRARQAAAIREASA